LTPPNAARYKPLEFRPVIGGQEDSPVARTVLVVDDSATIRKAVELSFLGEDVQVVSVAAPDAALAKAREVRPDAVIVDSSLPGGGYSVANAVKSDGATGAPPVLLLTSSRNPFDASKGQASGVDDSIDKPFESRVLIEKVNALFGKPRAAVAPSPYREPAVVAAPPPAPHAPPPPPAAAFATPPPPKPAAPPAPPPSAIVAPRPAAPAPAAAPAPIPLPKPAAAPVAVAPKPAVTRPDLPSILPEAPRPAAAAAPSGDGAAIARAVAAGVSKEQAEAIAKLTREVLERVVWEVVPDLAEAIIKEELARLTKE
jgi:CheY-like chemotaxis protein